MAAPKIAARGWPATRQLNTRRRPVRAPERVPSHTKPMRSWHGRVQPHTGLTGRPWRAFFCSGLVALSEVEQSLRNLLIRYEGRDASVVLRLIEQLPRAVVHCLPTTRKWNRHRHVWF